MFKIVIVDGGQMIRFIKWRHVDGPMLVRANGEVRWLTLGERLACWLGLMRFLEMDPITKKGTP